MKILIRDETGIRELEEGFASESELQQFLMTHADLMPLEDIDLSAPPLLCIGWEVGVVSGAEDILYVDSSGLLTVVETKLRRNPESRREVVGQILEYASQMASWTSSDVERQAESFFNSNHSPQAHSGRSLRQAMESHSAVGEEGEFDYEEFLQAIQEHIDNGHFRLVIAIDEPPDPLLKTVEFVNRFSEHFELYLVHLKRFSDAATRADIFVPAIFGKVVPPPSGGGPRPSRRWDYDDFFKELRKSQDDATIAYVTEIYERFKEWTDEDLWGSGVTYGSFNLVARKGDLRINLAAITTRGILYLSFGSMMAKLPLGLVSAFKQELEAIVGISLPEDVSHRSPGLSRDVLGDPDARAAVLVAIKRLLDGIYAQ